MVGLGSKCKTPTTEPIATIEIRLPNSDTKSIHLNLNAPMLLDTQRHNQGPLEIDFISDS